ncbi:MAG: Ig-like domain-containing protein [Gemmatimonadales bacterium]
MRRNHRLFVTGLASLCALTAACGIFEALEGPRIADVALGYAGPTMIGVGDTAAFQITATVDGESLENPRVTVSSSDLAIVEVLPAGRLAGRAIGRVTLTIRLPHSLLVDSVPTLLQDVRVRSAGGP